MLNHKIKIGLIGMGIALAGLGALSSLPASSATVSEIQGQLSAAAEEGAGYGPAQDPRVTTAVMIRTFLGVIGIIFVILTIYAGATWMLSAGNEEKITKAKNILKASVIGLIIVLSAYAITSLAIRLALGGRTRPLTTSPGPTETSDLLD